VVELECLPGGEAGLAGDDGSEESGIERAARGVDLWGACEREHLVIVGVFAGFRNY
jgi:hypothetical protein